MADQSDTANTNVNDNVDNTNENTTADANENANADANADAGDEPIIGGGGKVERKLSALRDNIKEKGQYSYYYGHTMDTVRLKQDSYWECWIQKNNWRPFAATVSICFRDSNSWNHQCEYDPTKMSM